MTPMSWRPRTWTICAVSLLLGACGGALPEDLDEGDEVAASLSRSGSLQGNPIRVFTAYGRMYAWNGLSATPRMRLGFPVDLTAVPRYALNRGPCAGRAAGTCTLDAVASPDGHTEAVFAYGQKWVWTDGLLGADFPKDLTTIARYARVPGAPCQGRAAGTCRFDAVTYANPSSEKVFAYGQLWSYTDGVLDAGFPKDLTTVARFGSNNGPCQGRARGTCVLDTHDYSPDGTVEIVTAYGRVWRWVSGALAAGFPRDLSADPSYASVGGPCEGRVGSCKLDSTELYVPANPNLQYFGAYNNGETTDRARRSLEYGNLLWYYVYFPEGKANPRDPEVVNGPFWSLLRAQPHARFGLPMADNTRPLEELKRYFERSLARIPADLRGRLAFFQTADEPFMHGNNAALKAKLDALHAHLQAIAPDVPTYVNFSYLEVQRGIVIPRDTDWVGYDCYRWVGCPDIQTSQNFLTTVESVLANGGPALAATRIVMIPQAHTHRNRNDEVQPAIDFLMDYYNLSIGHPKVVAIMPFSAGDYPGVFGYDDGTPASNLIRDNGVRPVGRQFAP